MTDDAGKALQIALLFPRYFMDRGCWGVEMDFLKHRMILCTKKGMGLPGTGVISGMREVCGQSFAENDVATMICDDLWFWTKGTNRCHTTTREFFCRMFLPVARISG